MTLTEFKRFADENNIVPISTEIYSQMISDSVKYAKMKEVLQEIRQEILDTKHIMTEGKTVKINNHSTVHDIVNGLNMAIGIVERHIKEIEGSDKE